MHAIEHMLGNINEKHRLFFLTLIISFVFLTLLNWTLNSLIDRILATIAILFVIFVTRPIWLPSDYGKNQIRRLSLIVLLATTTAVVNANQFIEINFYDNFRYFFPNFTIGTSVADRSGNVILIIALLTVWSAVLFIHYTLRDKTAMTVKEDAEDSSLRAKSFLKRFNAFCGILRDDLTQMDLSTNWSHEYFAPLDAEVEILSGRRKIRRLVDLLDAIKADRRSRIFLVLGDPGSGKSVALRKLCRELLEEATTTNRIPVYVNLKEWIPKTPWTKDNPPTDGDLREFVKTNLSRRLDAFARNFIEEWFEKLLQEGMLFLVLDSFDEIPEVLDKDENSWLVKELSRVISRFIAGSHGSRGVLASRYYRRPTINVEASTILHIRPFSELKISHAIKNYMEHPQGLLDQLFKEREDLLPIAKSPFVCGLLCLYAKKHRNRLPKRQADLYESFLDTLLNDVEDQLRVRGLSRDSLLSQAGQIAEYMFETPGRGLEVTVQEITKELAGDEIVDVMDILSDARVGRLGPRPQRQFSFSHRRFNEYFLVQRFIDNPNALPLEAIPTDTRWRDALVLFAEIAEPEDAKRIALFCWDEIEKNALQNQGHERDGLLRAIHCLRFLNDAFRTRKEILAPFAAQLSEFIHDNIVNNDDILTMKMSVEAVGLLEQKDVERAIVDALDQQNAWITETAFRACRYMRKLGDEIQYRLKRYFAIMERQEIIGRRHENMFYLKASDVFKEVLEFYSRKLIMSYLFYGWYVVVMVVYPMLTLTVTLVTGIGRVLCDLGVIREVNARMLLRLNYCGPAMLVTPAVMACVVLGVRGIGLGVEYVQQKISKPEGGAVNTELLLDEGGSESFFSSPVDAVSQYAGEMAGFWEALARGAQLIVWSPVETIMPPALSVVPLWIAVASFVAILSIIAFPWVEIKYLVATKYTAQISKTRGFLLKGLLVILAYLLALTMVMIIFGVFQEEIELIKKWFFDNLYFLYTIFQWFVILMWIILLLAMIVLIISIMGLAGFTLKDLFGAFQTDRRHLKAYSQEPPTTRAEIHSQFLSFNTPVCRQRYVRMLESYVDSPEGSWPEGHAPNLSGGSMVDEASTELAQLDERWSGLER